MIVTAMAMEVVVSLAVTRGLGRRVPLATCTPASIFEHAMLRALPAQAARALMALAMGGMGVKLSDSLSQHARACHATNQLKSHSQLGACAREYHS